VSVNINPRENIFKNLFKLPHFGTCPFRSIIESYTGTGWRVYSPLVIGIAHGF
jgi:hypothetical protein